MERFSSRAPDFHGGISRQVGLQPDEGVTLGGADVGPACLDLNAAHPAIFEGHEVHRPFGACGTDARPAVGFELSADAVFRSCLGRSWDWANLKGR